MSINAIDFHVHSKYGNDGRHGIVDFVETAFDHGLQTVTAFKIRACPTNFQN